MGQLGSWRAPARGRLVVPFVLALAAWGCVSLGGLEPPELTLADLAFVDATLFESTLEASLRVTNGNPEPLEVDGVSLRLSLGGVSVGRGTGDVRVQIPRFGSAVVPVTVHVSNLKMVARLRALLEAEAIDWGVDGRIYVLRGTGTARVPVSAAGRLDLRGGQAGTPPADAPE